MNEFHLGYRVEYYLGKTGHLHAHGFKVEFGAHRILHPGIGNQNPHGREVGAKGHQPGTRQVLYFAQPIPAKEEHADEGGFQEERHQRLNGQRGTKNIAHVVRVIGPVGAKLELHGQPGGHAYGKVDSEQFAPESGHVLVDLLARHDVDGLHNRQDKGHTQGQRHKQKVIERSNCKLKAREIYDFIQNHMTPPHVSSGKKPG